MKKQISSELKSKIAIEAIRNLRSVNEIASEYGVYPSQVSQWKKQYLAVGESIFETKQSTQKDKEQVDLLDSLYKKIGQLEVEREYLKKKWHQMGGK